MLDDFNREGFGIEVDFSLPAMRVVRNLNQIIDWRDKPATIRVYNDPAYVSALLMQWAGKRGIAIEYTQLGKLQQNACAERNNRTMRHEWLAKTSLKRYRRPRIRPRNGSGHATTTGKTWPSAALHPL